MSQVKGASGLTVKNLVKRFKYFQLGPIGFDLDRGKAYGLLGPNGSGKTTLLNCLGVQAKLDEGVIYWGNRPIGWGDWKFREEISFVRENPILYEELTVEQILRFASCVYESWDEVFARHWLERLRLEHKKPIRTLSKGMRVKLSLIVALSHDAGLLLLDEPTSGLDPDARLEIQNLLREMTYDRNTCSLISSHLFEDVDSICDEIMFLRSGKIVFRSSLDDMQNMRMYRLLPDRFRNLSPEPTVLLQWTHNGAHLMVVRNGIKVSANVEQALSSALESRPVTARDIYFALRG